MVNRVGQSQVAWPLQNAGPTKLFRGLVFAGKFQLAKHIAQGGMSEVRSRLADALARVKKLEVKIANG